MYDYENQEKVKKNSIQKDGFILWIKKKKIFQDVPNFFLNVSKILTLIFRRAEKKNRRNFFFFNIFPKKKNLI